jgi:hypothetical protein
MRQKKALFFFEKKNQKTFARGPLVFMHVPKCSGIAVAGALLAVERPPTIFFGFDLAFFGGFRDFESVSPANRAFIHLSPDSIPRDVNFVRAHMALSTLRTAYPGGRFMTVLREPVTRLLSHFAFWRGFPADDTAAWGGWAARAALAQGPLEAFLGAPSIACQIDNVATRLLLWPHALIPDDGMIDPTDDAALLRLAMARLRSLDFVDVVENPDFYANLGAWVGGTLRPERCNETESVPPALRTSLKRELTSRAGALLAARSRLDLALWREVVRARDPACDVDALRQTALLRAAARTALLLAGAGEQ